MASNINNKYDFTGKVALVTGSSSGIGAAIALQFAQYGAQVTITGRNAETLTNVGQQINEQTGKQALQVIGDLQKDDSLPARLINETVAHFGRLDFLVNNAGSATPNDKLSNENLLQEYDQLFRLNLRSAIELIHLAVPHLEKTKGNIINISSIASLRPVSTTVKTFMLSFIIQVYLFRKVLNTIFLVFVGI